MVFVKILLQQLIAHRNTSTVRIALISSELFTWRQHVYLVPHLLWYLSIARKESRQNALISLDKSSSGTLNDKGASLYYSFILMLLKKEVTVKLHMKLELGDMA